MSCVGECLFLGYSLLSKVSECWLSVVGVFKRECMRMLKARRGAGQEGIILAIVKETQSQEMKLPTFQHFRATIV